MRRPFFSFLMFFLLFSCALLPKKAGIITWPEDINYIEAMCELDMVWANINYSGSMSLIMEYPDRLSIEAYSPFGDTIFFLNRFKDFFLLLMDGERIIEEKGFAERFKIDIRDFIEDLALKNAKEVSKKDGEINKGRYRVVYRLMGQNTICWEAEEGKICIKFIDAKFTREG